MRIDGSAESDMFDHTGYCKSVYNFGLVLASLQESSSETSETRFTFLHACKYTYVQVKSFLFLRSWRKSLTGTNSARWAVQQASRIHLFDMLRAGITSAIH